MEYNKNTKTEKLLTIHKKIYINDNDNTSTDITERLNDSKKSPQEKLIGNYSIEKIIDKNLTSKVVLAKHIITGEKVAIKILNKKLFIKDILSLKRIKKEIQILKMVKHENIIKLLEIIENKNKVYLITDYYPNQLLSLIIKNTKLPEEKALNYFYQYINGLHYLHQNGICHRNIKPDNLLLDENNEKIKIIDFGLSTTYIKNKLLNSLVGEIIYAPPEMHLSENYSGELIDIWKAGLVLYTMLCGHLPFCEEDEEKNINHIITGFYEIPSNINSHCAYLIKSCLQIDPNKRINFEQLSKYVKYTKGLIFNINIIPLDELVIEECKKYLGNINNQDIIEQIKESVKNNKFNEFNALYYLVLNKMVKIGYKSISDLSSEKFKYHIEYTEQKDELHYYERKALSNSFINNNINKLNKSYNSNTYKNSSLNSIPSYKNQFICSPLVTKTYNNKRSLSIGRNESKIKTILNSNISDSNISCKNVMKTSIKLDNTEKNNNLKINCFKSISPKVIFNKKKDFLYFKKKQFVKKNLLNSYSSWKNTRFNSEMINRCNSCENKFTDKIVYDNNITNTNNIQLIKSIKVPSMRKYKTQNEKNNSSEKIKIFYKPKKQDKSRKTIEILKKIKNSNINKNKHLYNRDKKSNFHLLFSEKNYSNNNLDENNDLINILTEDKPIENFNINFNNKRFINKQTNNIKIKNNLSVKKYNDYYYKPKNNVRDGSLSHRLKVRKNAFIRGITTIFKNGIKIKKLLNNDNNNIKIENEYLINENNLSERSTLKILEEEKKNIKDTQNIKKNNSLINKSYNLNITHKKNNSALLVNILDYNNKNTRDYYDKNIDKEIKNYDINEKNKKVNNKNLECYDVGTYDIGVIDLFCLKIESIDKVKEKINKVLKSKKICYKNIKNNKYRCSKLGNFFDIDIFSLENFLSLNNNNRINNKNNERESISYKKNKENQKILCYLSFHIKKNDIKKSVNSIIRENLV